MRALILTGTIFFALFLSSPAVAQNDYTYVDSVSYRLYMENRWKELNRLGQCIDRDSIDYYYLDLRLGIACFETGKWNQAERYFRAAMDKNPAGETAPLYLRSILSDRGWRTESSEMVQEYDSSDKQRATGNIQKIIADFYAEAGRKSSDNNEIAGAVNYYFLGWQQTLSPKWTIRHRMSFVEQALNWSTYDQFGYSLTSTYYLGKGWEAGLNAGMISFRRDVNSFIDNTELISRTNIPSPQGNVIRDSIYITQTTIQGRTKVLSGVLHLSVNKRIRDFSLGLQGAYYHDQISPLLDSVSLENRRTVFLHPVNPVNIIDRIEVDTVQINTRNNIGYYQLGAGLYYTFRINGRLSLAIGGEGQYILSDQIHEVFLMPQLLLINRGKYSLQAYYFDKGYYPVSVSGGTQIYNTPDRINQKISCTLGVHLGKNTTVYLTGQHEEITDAFTGGQYRLLSAYLGTYIKL